MHSLMANNMHREETTLYMTAGDVLRAHQQDVDVWTIAVTLNKKYIPKLVCSSIVHDLLLEYIEHKSKRHNDYIFI